MRRVVCGRRGAVEVREGGVISIPFRCLDAIEKREVLIRRCLLRLQVSDDAVVRRVQWTRARDLINGRSAEQVERMERARGLR